MLKACNSPHSIDYVVEDLECKLTEKIDDCNLVNYLLLIASGMISYYGQEYKYYIYDTILDTVYLVNNVDDGIISRTINSLFNKNTHEFENNSVITICNVEKDYSRNSLKAYRAKYALSIINNRINPIDLLEGLLRELNRIFLSKKHTFNYYDNNIFIRNGISSVLLDKVEGPEDKKTINDIISYLQLEDILKTFKTLSYDGNNKELNKLLNTIKKYDMNNMVLDCCLPLVNLFRPLFELNDIKRMLNINIFEGNINIISNEFDSVLGVGSFDRMSKKLDKLYNDFCFGYLGGNISEYSLSKEYVAIRDNFVNKYIKKKYA